MASTKKQGARRSRTAFEWSILVVALVAIAAVFVGLLVSGSRGGGSVRLSVTVTGARASPAGDVVEIRVTNDGRVSAEDVVVRVEAGDWSGEVTIDEVSKGDREDVEVIAPHGEGASARASVVGYRLP